MVDSITYFREYNKKPKRKIYLAQKARERYYKTKKGVGNLVCPNCQTVQEFNLVIKKRNNN